MNDFKKGVLVATFAAARNEILQLQGYLNTDKTACFFAERAGIVHEFPGKDNKEKVNLWTIEGTAYDLQKDFTVEDARRFAEMLESLEAALSKVVNNDPLSRESAKALIMIIRLIESNAGIIKAQLKED